MPKAKKKKQDERLGAYSVLILQGLASNSSLYEERVKQVNAGHKPQAIVSLALKIAKELIEEIDGDK